MTERVTVEAADRVIRGLLKILAEEQTKIEVLQARLADPSLNWRPPTALNDWEQLNGKVQELLGLCDEQERQADEYKYRVDREACVIHVSEIRRLLG